MGVAVILARSYVGLNLLAMRWGGKRIAERDQEIEPRRLRRLSRITGNVFNYESNM